MRAVLCLFVVVACAQPNLISGGGIVGFFRAVLSHHDETNVWPYKQEKFSHPRQSPIDLVTSKAVTRNLPTLQFIRAEMKGHHAKFYNSGHTVYVYMNDSVKDRPKLTGGPLMEDTFYFEQMHFHWGSEDVWGSEHFIDGNSFATEIHLVHWNSKYGSFQNAAQKEDGLAVLTVFAKETNGTVGDNPLLKPLQNLLGSVSEADSFEMMDTNDAMQWALSAITINSEYYTYPGSLTTAPYSENVVFILLPKPITLSCDQLHEFRKVHDQHGGYITDNKRMLQPLHERPIVRAVRAVVV